MCAVGRPKKSSRARHVFSLSPLNSPSNNKINWEELLLLEVASDFDKKLQRWIKEADSSPKV